MRNEYTRPCLVQQRITDIPDELRLRVRIQSRRLRTRLTLQPKKTKKLTASSKKSIGGSFNKTLATANLCFSPPLTISPLSPTCVPYPSGRLITALCIFALLVAAFTSFAPASIRPYCTLCIISAWTRGVSCGTTPIAFRMLSSVTEEMSWSSMKIRPEEGGSNRKRRRKMVDLPHPDGPTMATCFPAGTVKERLVSSVYMSRMSM